MNGDDGNNNVFFLSNRLAIRLAPFIQFRSFLTTTSTTLFAFEHCEWPRRWPKTLNYSWKIENCLRIDFASEEIYSIDVCSFLAPTLDFRLALSLFIAFNHSVWRCLRNRHMPLWPFNTSQFYRIASPTRQAKWNYSLFSKPTNERNKHFQNETDFPVVRISHVYSKLRK